MPAAAIGAGIGGLGSIASGASGKKSQGNANKLAQQQLGLQQQQFGLAQQQTGLGNAALGGASNYWNALLSGNRTAAAQATGPYAAMQGQAAEGARQAIAATTPRGGEQNLALAQNYNDLSNNVARLYAGMQPLAAQSLGQLGGEYLGSGTAFNPQSSPYAALGAYTTGVDSANQAGAGFGSLLYNSINKLKQGGTRGKQSPAPAVT